MQESSFLQSLMSAWDETGQFSSDEFEDTTSSAHFNAVLRVARMFLVDRASPREFLEELQIVTGRLEAALGALTGEPERIGAVRDAYREVRQGLLDMTRYFDDRDEERIRGGISRVEAAAARLAELGEDFDAVQATGTSLPCRMCGQANPPAGGACLRCGAVLVPDAPPLVEGIPEEIAGAPAELMTLYSASEQVVLNAFPRDLWRGMVETEMARCDGLHQQVEALLELLGENASSGILDLGEALKAHLVEAWQAAEAMLRFEQDGQVQDLARNWMQMVQAVGRAQRAGAWFWDNAETLATRLGLLTAEVP